MSQIAARYACDFLEIAADVPAARAIGLCHEHSAIHAWPACASNATRRIDSDEAARIGSDKTEAPADVKRAAGGHNGVHEAVCDPKRRVSALSPGGAGKHQDSQEQRDTGSVASRTNPVRGTDAITERDRAHGRLRKNPSLDPAEA